jgi:hypothetical protein
MDFEQRAYLSGILGEDFILFIRYSIFQNGREHGVAGLSYIFDPTCITSARK